MVNIDLLKREIEDCGITKIAFAEKCGFTRQTLDNKLERPETISANDAYNMAAALRINDTNRLLAIFFAPKVEPNSNFEGVS